jgi:cytochrome c-type biogenesis protein CcmH/NrfG
MVSDITLQKWRSEFDAMSDDDLRLLAASGRVRERRLDLLFLLIQERERAESEISRSEDLAIAKEANRLAATANDKASTANTIATVAVIIASVAIAISIVTAFLGNR